MSNIRLSTILCLKGGLFNLRVRALYIKVFNILNSFKLEFKVKFKILKDKSGFIVKGLIKTFRGTIYLQGI